MTTAGAGSSKDIAKNTTDYDCIDLVNTPDSESETNQHEASWALLGDPTSREIRRIVLSYLDNADVSRRYVHDRSRDCINTHDRTDGFNGAVRRVMRPKNETREEERMVGLVRCIKHVQVRRPKNETEILPTGMLDALVDLNVQQRSTEGIAKFLTMEHIITLRPSEYISGEVINVMAQALHDAYPSCQFNNHKEGATTMIMNTYFFAKLCERVDPELKAFFRSFCSPEANSKWRQQRKDRDSTPPCDNTIYKAMKGWTRSIPLKKKIASW